MLTFRAAALAAIPLSVTLSAQAHWTLLYPTPSPPARNQHAMAFDPVGGSLLVFGGYGGGLRSDTWSFDGSGWTQRVVGGPSARGVHAMVGDEARGVVVLFGGLGTQPLQDTWEWNGNSWNMRAPLHQPSARFGAGMAYDLQRQVVVLFGGVNFSTSFGDTWEWNGQDWTQRVSGVSPAARSSAAMAFDPTLGGVLLFGGGASNMPAFFDTWRWTGSAWQQLQPTNPPFARSSHCMVADVARRRVVMWGGLTWDPAIWEWDGASWSVRSFPGPTPRTDSAMAYDPVRSATVLFAGGNSSPFQDTWVYRTDAPATFETIGPGCAGTAGTPALANAPYSLPWIGDTFTTRVAPVPANGALLFATGFDVPSPVSLTPYGMPGCDFAVQIAETRLAIATAGGSADWSLVIPNAAGLAGVAIAQQVLVLDPAANAAGAVVSSAGRFTVGIR